jgi:1,4-alpha-glucan branching enzyme
VQRLLRDLNRIYVSQPAFSQIDYSWEGFEWMDCNDADAGVLTFVRRSRNPEDVLLVVMNVTPVVRYDYQVGVPAAGFYREVLNTDAAEYWGSGVGNLGGVEAEEIAHLDKPYSLRLTIPPLAVMYFKREGESAIT